MFEKHFNLTENPFSLTPDPRFIYPGRSHEEALATLRYWVEHREGFVMVSGEVGTGKTTALFRLIDSLEQRFEIAFITNSTLSTVELLEEVCRRFKIEGITPGMSKSALLQRLESYLLKLRELRHAAILIIDEAQNFNSELLEEVRLLSNTAVPSGPPLLQIALVGQPELERKLSLEELRQLRQRIGVHYRIEPLSEDETIRYVRHRIAVAGGNPEVVFRTDACRQLFRYTRGLPREINQLASQTLLHAFVDGSNGVTPEHVRAAAWEMQFRSVLDRDGVPAAPGAQAALGGVAPSAAAPQPVSPGHAAPTPIAATPIAPTPTVPIPIGPTRIEPTPLAETIAAADLKLAVAPTARTASEPGVVADATPTAPPQLKTVPPLELSTARGRSSAEPAESVPRITRVSRLGPLPETGAKPEESGGSSWKRYGLIALAVGLLAAVGWLVFAPKPQAPEPTIGTGAPESGGSPPSGPADQSRQEALTESQSAQGADSANLQGGTTPPLPGSAAADSASRRLEEMERAGGAPAVAPAGQEPSVPGSSTPPPSSTATVPPPSEAPAETKPGQLSGGLPSTQWRLQVASFRDSSLAHREGRRLAQRMNWSYEVVRSRRSAEGAMHAVFVGPFATQADADSASRQISALKLGFKEAIPRPPRSPR